MIDHAHTIRQRAEENARIAEMDSRSAPLLWLVYVAAFAVCFWVIYEQHQTHKDLASLKADFQTVQNGGIIGVGDDAVMACMHCAEGYRGGGMTDRELLEMAAKATGYAFVQYHNQTDWTGPWAEVRKPESTLGNCRWNPLTNDGDALRLLAVLPSLWGLSLKFGTPSIKMSVAWGTGRGIEAVEFAGEGADRATAIRRAIVRAAAEIGKELT